jgi:hypothetical protein
VLEEALAGVELGDYDKRVIEKLCREDIPVVATIASLFRRAGRIGVGEVDGAS